MPAVEVGAGDNITGKARRVQVGVTVVFLQGLKGSEKEDDLGIWREVKNE